jgi:hypothetical protein
MNCTICHKPVVLVPSATERAKRYGGTPSDTRLFPAHSACELAKRAADTSELMARQTSANL